MVLIHPHTLAILGVLVVLPGCTGSRSPSTRLTGAIGERPLTLSRAHHHTLTELDHGSHAAQIRPGRLNKVQRCKAQLKLVVTGTRDGCRASLPPVGDPAAAHTLIVTLDLTSADPARANVTNVVLSSGGRAFWGEGTMLLSGNTLARLPRKVRCNPPPNVLFTEAITGHLILSFYADRKRGGERLGWLEGDFSSRGCSQKSDEVASIE